MTCDELRELLPDLALGLLDGQERATVLHHAEECSVCQAEIDQFSAVVDAMAFLAPPVHPPAGFESRVIARLGSKVEARPRLPRWLRVPVAAALAALVLGGAGGWVLAHHEGASVPPATAAGRGNADMVEAVFRQGTRTVGEVFADLGRSGWVYMDVDGARVSGPVTCQVVESGSRTIAVGTFMLDHGSGYWSVPVSWTAGRPTGARLLSPGGRVIATAEFSA